MTYSWDWVNNLGYEFEDNFDSWFNYFTNLYFDFNIVFTEQFDDWQDYIDELHWGWMEFVDEFEEDFETWQSYLDDLYWGWISDIHPYNEFIEDFDDWLDYDYTLNDDINNWLVSLGKDIIFYDVLNNWLRWLGTDIYSTDNIDLWTYVFGKKIRIEEDIENWLSKFGKRIDYTDNINDWLFRLGKDIDYTDNINDWLFRLGKDIDYTDNIETWMVDLFSKRLTFKFPPQNKLRDETSYQPDYSEEIKMNRLDVENVVGYYPVFTTKQSTKDMWNSFPYKLIGLQYSIYENRNKGNNIIGSCAGEENKNIDTIEEELDMNYPDKDYISLPLGEHSIKQRNNVTPRSKTIVVPYMNDVSEKGLRYKISFGNNTFYTLIFKVVDGCEMVIYDGIATYNESITEGSFFISKLNDEYYFTSYDSSTDTTTTVEIYYDKDTFELNVIPDSVLNLDITCSELVV